MGGAKIGDCIHVGERSNTHGRDIFPFHVADARLFLVNVPSRRRMRAGSGLR